MKLQKEGFLPIVWEKPQILILGTFPGNESLAANQYYANNRNAFWFIMGKLLNMKSDANYKSKKEILKENGLALWDVFKSCERNGSLDSSIKTKTIQMNDFKSFFTAYPSIKLIFFNGKKAQDEYVKRVLPLLFDTQFKNIKYQVLPSTSPAMARLTMKQKFAKWSIIIKSFKSHRKAATM